MKFKYLTFIVLITLLSSSCSDKNRENSSIVTVNDTQDSSKIIVAPFESEVASCGCFAWVGEKIFQDGNMIYQDVEMQKGRFINMNINGHIVEFSFQNKQENNKYFSIEKGELFNEMLSSKKFQVKSKWKTNEIVHSPDDETEKSINYDVIFTITRNGTNKKKIIEAKGYCGC